MLEIEERIKAIHRNLGISSAYESQYRLTIQAEESNLVDIEHDIYGRPQKLVRDAAESWRKMKLQAENEGVILYAVSAFRSVNKQAEIIRRKIEAEQHLSEILRVCAAPGYSEHHTGRALDLTTVGCEPLSELFELTDAYKWLQENAYIYWFTLSYPKRNKLGIAYEPWHWAYNPR